MGCLKLQYHPVIGRFIPDGSLKKYDPQKGEDKKPVATDMPSDKNDPERKNKVEPTDIPKEKDEKNKVNY